FKIHLGGAAIASFSHKFVDEVSPCRSDDHHYAHYEYPDQQLDLYSLEVWAHLLRIDGQQYERDQRHAGHTISLETIRAWPHRIACVVARAIGDDARIARVVFLDLEDDLHQVGTDVGDLGEDTARNAQRRRA